MTPSPALKFGLLIAVAVTVIAATVAFAILHSDDFDSRVRFSLTDHTGASVSEDTYHGQHLLVYFGFTSCPKVCPTQMAKLTRALDELDREQEEERILPIFITVDPDRDSAERIVSYLAHFHPRFVGLTGSRDALARAAESFKAYGARRSSAADDDPSRHTSVAYLVDPGGRVITHIASTASATEAAQRIRGHLP